MLIKQLSIFLENRAGRAKDVVEHLANNDINILAFTMADRAEFGVLRLIVSDTDKATKILSEAGFVTVATDVVSIPCSNATGSLAKLMKLFADNNISIEYMYAVYDDNQARLILRTADMEKCLSLTKANGLE